MSEQFGLEFFRAVLDAIPSPVFIVDKDVRILAYNAAAVPLLGEKPDLVLRMRSGEALHCINATGTQGGCGCSEECRACVVRNSVRSSFGNQSVVRQKSRMTLVREGGSSEVFLLVTTAPLKHEGASYVILILEDISELVELRRLIPICANCKKIRNERQYWDSVETYFKRQMDLDFTHGICPECFERLYPDLAASWKASRQPPP